MSTTNAIPRGGSRATLRAQERSGGASSLPSSARGPGAGQFGGFITTVDVAAVIAAIRDSLLCVPSGPPMT